MRNLFILLFTLTVTSTSVHAEEAFRALASNAILKVATSFNKTITDKVTDHEGRVDTLIIEGIAYEEALELGHFLADKVEDMRNPNIPAEQTLLSVGDRMFDYYEIFQIGWFAQIVQRYNQQQLVSEEQRLANEIKIMKANIAAVEAMGSRAPERTYAKLERLISLRAENTELLQYEVERILKTVGSMVTETVIDGVRYQVIQTTDETLGIKSASPGGEKIRCQSGFCPPNRPGHTAIDISQGLHSKIYAVFSGYVTLHRGLGGLGYAIEIYSPQFDMTLVYAHCGSPPGRIPWVKPFLVKNGTYVTAGTPIGREGYSGHVEPTCKDCLGNHTHIIAAKGKWEWKKSNILNLEKLMPTFVKNTYFDGSIVETIYLKETNGDYGQWEVISEKEFLKTKENASEIEIAFMNK
jgi:murein DD-endopeptidase MepM/ murein hydrolase activator NlpD